MFYNVINFKEKVWSYEKTTKPAFAAAAAAILAVGGSLTAFAVSTDSGETPNNALTVGFAEAAEANEETDESTKKATSDIKGTFFCSAKHLTKAII